VLAVLGPERLADFPDYPTAPEQGVPYDAVGWRGIMLPKGTPSVIAKLLNEKLAEIAASDEFRQFMKKNGFAVMVRGPGEFAEFLRAEDARWREVIKNAGYETLGRNHDPGPRAMPILLATLLVLCLVSEGFLSRRRESALTSGPALRTPHSALEQSLLASAAKNKELSASWMSADAVFLLVALVVYVVAMAWIGFSASTFVFATAVMWRLGTKWWLAAAGSMVIVVAIHLLFVTLFRVQLP